MKVVVSSANPVKLEAAREAFELVFAGEAPEILSLSVPSGVSDQPLSDDETRRGAVNRVRAAHEQSPDADYWVGMEGGLERIGDELMASAWMTAMNRDGRLGAARTTSLPLPQRITRLVDDGMELGEANDRVFSTHNSKQAGGAFGLLTDGLLTRQSVYRDALVSALIPLIRTMYVDD